MNHHGKPAKIIIIVKAFHQGSVCAEHTQAWGEGLHTQQCQTRWCLACQVSSHEMKVGMEPQAAQQPFTTLLQVMKYLWVPRHLPNTSKRGVIVSYGKKKKQQLQWVTPLQLTFKSNRDGLAVEWWEVITPKLGTSSCAGQDGIRSCGTERAHDEIFEVKCYFPF